jgi:ferritin-like metal-binding protein YciE
MEQTGLMNFFLTRLIDLYLAEKKFMKSFVALSIAAYTEELRTALNSPSTEAETHLNRLEMVLESLKVKPGKNECTIVTALVEKARDLIVKNEPGTSMRDAAIIYVAQHIEHYKIASYTVLLEVSKELKLEQASVLLAQCLKEEQDTAAYLSQIAANIINPAAVKDIV